MHRSVRARNFAGVHILNPVDVLFLLPLPKQYSLLFGNYLCTFPNPVPTPFFEPIKFGFSSDNIVKTTTMENLLENNVP